MSMRNRRDAPLPTHKGPGARVVISFAVGGLITAAAIMVVAFKLYAFSIEQSRPPELPPLPDEDVRPSALPDLARAAPLPDAAAIAAQAATAAAKLAESPVLPIWADGNDDFSLAWAEAILARDRAAAPPTPRVGPWELFRANLPLGTPLAISGTLLAAGGPAAGETGAGTGAPLAEAGAAADTTWRRRLLEVDRHVYVTLLLPPGLAVAVDAAPRLVSGRYLGFEDLPAGSGMVRTPLLLAREVAALPDQQQAAPEPDAAATWAGIDDNGLVLERAPFYALLGQVAREDDGEAWRDPPLLNARSNDVHNDPAAFRGQAFRAMGTVLRVWRDEGVARDQPFGVLNATRVMMFHRDWGPYTEEVDGKTGIFNRSVLRLYEFAIPDHRLGALAPRAGDHLMISGRFLKLNARPIRLDAEAMAGIRAPIKVRSDRVYTFFLVGHGVSTMPDPSKPHLPRLTIGIAVFTICAGSFLLWFAWREWREFRTLSASLVVSAGRRRALMEGVQGARPSPAMPSAPPAPPSSADGAPPAT